MGSNHYALIDSCLSTLEGSVSTAIALDQADLATLQSIAMANPALMPVYMAAVAQTAVVTAALRGRMTAIRAFAASSRLVTADSVADRKRAEAEVLRVKSKGLGDASSRAQDLRAQSVNAEWLGDASDLYRDTAQATADNLADMAESYGELARYCEQTAQFHDHTYAATAQGVSTAALQIASLPGSPFNVPARSAAAFSYLDRAQQFLEAGADGRLTEAFMAQVSQSASAQFYETVYLGPEFRADPSRASVKSDTTVAG